MACALPWAAKPVIVWQESELGKRPGQPLLTTVPLQYCLDRQQGHAKGIFGLTSHEGWHLKQFSTSLALYCRVSIKNQPMSWWET